MNKAPGIMPMMFSAKERPDRKVFSLFLVKVLFRINPKIENKIMELKSLKYSEFS